MIHCVLLPEKFMFFSSTRSLLASSRAHYGGEIQLCEYNIILKLLTTATGISYITPTSNASLFCGSTDSTLVVIALFCNRLSDPLWPNAPHPIIDILPKYWNNYLPKIKWSRIKKGGKTRDWKWGLPIKIWVSIQICRLKHITNLDRCLLYL